MRNIKALFIAAALLAGVQAANAQDVKPVKVSGFLQTGYTLDEDHNNTFYTKRARMSLSGDLFNEGEQKLSYKAQVDFAGTPKLIDMFVKYSFNNHIGIQLGQAKTPLSFENSEYAPTKLEFIDYSLVVRKMAMAGGCTGRDLGVQLFGSFLPQDGYNMITYQAGFFNGEGINATDVNIGKNLIARVMVNPLKELTLSAYFLSRLGDHTDPLLVGTPYDVSHFSRTGAGVNYDTDQYFARAEYIYGYQNGTKAEGAYGQLGYKFSPKVNMGVRYDYYTDNVDGKAKNNNVSVAANYTPVKNFRLQFNYILQQNTDALDNTDTTNGISILATLTY